MTEVRITFVLPEGTSSESEASETMVQTYEACKQLVENISWIQESELPKKKFTKLDYVVFEHFEGKDFQKLVESKCAVVGPLAVSVCLMEGKSIPSFQWPILNVAMYDCVVTCSTLPKSVKEEIKNKVQLMGGLFTAHIIASTTHVVCDGTKSVKYMLAAEKGIKLMLPSWVDDVWEQSQQVNVNSNEEKILEKHKCPPFHKLTICSTGITSKDKAKLTEMVTSNGGTMVATLKISETDVLICHGVAGTTSEKYKAAIKAPNLACVTREWVFDSVEKGVALPYERYKVKAVTSTPTKEGENIDPNFSTISAIGGMSMAQKSVFNETASVTFQSKTLAVPGSFNGKSGGAIKRKATEDLVEKLDIKKVKSAGQFLDGCSIFVTGFSPNRREKLNKIVNLSGATRYDDVSDRITHVIVGDPSCSKVETIKSMGLNCAVVSVQWLLDSVDQKGPAKEDNYVINKPDKSGDTGSFGSPLSKKALSLLKNAKVTTEAEEDATKRLETDIDEREDPLIKPYLQRGSTEKEEEDTLAMLLKENAGLSKNKEDEFTIKSRSLSRRSPEAPPQPSTMDFRPHETSTQISQVTTDISDNTEANPIFQAMKFLLAGFDEENTDMLEEHIRGVEGRIVDKNFKGVADFAVVPMFNQPETLPTVQEIINQLWVIESIQAESVCEIQYYHRPMVLPTSKPLADCVVAITVYAAQERQFLFTLIEGLGGICQEQFSRKNMPEMGVLASTHLLSPEATSKKYRAAIKWKIPVVNKDWLLECAKTGKRVPIKPYLIGESTSPVEEDPVDTTLKTNAKDVNFSANSNESSNNETNKSEAPADNNETAGGTPGGAKKSINNEANVHTPVNQIYNINPRDTPDACSQVTPINKILQDAFDNKMLPSLPSPKTYYPWDPKTPDTPLGAFIRPDPSPRLRKEMQKYINSFPDFVPPKRRLSTPLSELKKRLKDKVLGRGEFAGSSQEQAGPSTQEAPDSEQEPAREPVNNSFGSLEKSENNESPAENAVVNQKLQELQQMVMNSGNSSTSRRSSKAFESTKIIPGTVPKNDVQSQICTVGWDYGEEDNQSQAPKKFMISGLEISQRGKLVEQLKSLGAEVSDSATFDTTCTHLLCAKFCRNEKSLASLASGKWILHYSYVEKCMEAGTFLNEVEYEYGNPKSRRNIPYDAQDECIYYWRKEIQRRGYGAFNDMRAIVFAEKADQLVSVIRAGGGVVVNVQPPFEDTIHATHCLLEPKMLLQKDVSVYAPLAQQGIKIVNTLYIHDFLKKTRRDESDYILPHFASYY